MALSLLLVVVMCYSQTGQKYNTTSNKKAYAAFQAAEDYALRLQPGNIEGLETLLGMYKEALSFDPNYLEALYRCADCYARLKQPGNQINCIQKAVGIDSTAWVKGYYQCAVALAQKSRFEESLKWFNLFDKFSAGKPSKIKQDPTWRKKAELYVYFMKHPVPFEPRYPTDRIEKTPFETYWPSLTLDETELVMTMRLPRDTVKFNQDPTMLTRLNNNETQEDMYMCKRTAPDIPWSSITPVYSINTDFNEGTQTLSPDGRWMFYTACGYADSKGSCDIYWSQRTEHGWTKGANIGEPVNSKAWESQPCFSADGKTLYFIRGAAGSAKRNASIYAAKVVGITPTGFPKFSKPVSLGDSINTAGDESHPFIHADGKTLFFSSDGWPGLGAKDMFVSRKKADGSWTTPLNVGYPINTTEDDEGLVVTADGTTGYYNSVRMIDGRFKREVKMFDLYPEIRPDPVPFVKGYITDCKTKRNIDATVLLDRMSDGRNIVTSRTLPDGSFSTALPGIDDYLLSVNAKGYFFRTVKFTAEAIRQQKGPVMIKGEDVCLTPLKIGQKIALRNIYFDTDKWDIKPESKVELDILVKIMKENPKLRVEISGHTDSRASVAHNQTLSENRAKSTVKYLVEHGIAAERFKTVGYGLSQPCATNETEEGRALNRRIEAKIIE